MRQHSLAIANGMAWCTKAPDLFQLDGGLKNYALTFPVNIPFVSWGHELKATISHKGDVIINFLTQELRERNHNIRNTLKIPPLGSHPVTSLCGSGSSLLRKKNSGEEAPPPRKDPAILKILRIVNVLRVVHVLRVVIRNRDNPCADTIFLGFTVLCPLKEGVTA